MARAYDGTTSNIITAASDAANGGAFSVSIRAYRATDTGTHGIAAKSGAATANPGDWLFYHDAGTSKYIFSAKWTTADGYWDIPRPTINTWAQAGFAYDGGSAANDPLMYIDGVSQTVNETQPPSGSRTTITDNVTIGNREAADIGWNGRLGEFGHWNRMLTAAEWAILGAGFSPLFIPNGLTEYVPLIRDLVSLKTTAPTQSGTTVIEHPRIIRPSRPLQGRRRLLDQIYFVRRQLRQLQAH